MFWSKLHGEHSEFAFTTSWRSSSAKLIGSKSRFTVACQCSPDELTDTRAANWWSQLCISVMKYCQVEYEWMKRNSECLLRSKLHEDICHENQTRSSLEVEFIRQITFLFSFFMLFVLFAWSFDFMILVESEVKKYHRRKWSRLVVFLTEPNQGNLGNILCQPEVVRFPAR